MVMTDHPNKHIREAVRYAEQNGWTFQHAGPRGHLYGTLYCPLRTRDGHRIRVDSTPLSPENHASRIRRAVNRCDHEPEA